MYGLGFLVLFQSLCVPTAKIAVYLVYYALVRTGRVRPYTIQDALEQVPPQKWCALKCEIITLKFNWLKTSIFIFYIYNEACVR